MKALFSFFAAAFVALGAAAQTRTYTDNATGTFIIGLESYFFGESGSISFEANGKTVHASVEGPMVSVDGVSMEKNDGETVIGIHDFTGNRTPELVVARRTQEGIAVTLYSLSAGTWSRLAAVGIPGVKEVRVFRQVLSARRGEVLSSWTWHTDRFDYKASDGSPEPSLP